jgi:hypothetical protein
VSAVRDDEISYIKQTINVANPGAWVYWTWSVDSELNEDFVFFYDGDTLPFNEGQKISNYCLTGIDSVCLSGTNSEAKRYALKPGQHTLYWGYAKSKSGSSGKDKAWLHWAVALPSKEPVEGMDLIKNGDFKAYTFNRKRNWFELKDWQVGGWFDERSFKSGFNSRGVWVRTWGMFKDGANSVASLTLSNLVSNDVSVIYQDVTVPPAGAVLQWRQELSSDQDHNFFFFYDNLELSGGFTGNDFKAACTRRATPQSRDDGLMYHYLVNGRSVFCFTGNAVGEQTLHLSEGNHRLAWGFFKDNANANIVRNYIALHDISLKVEAS